VATSSSRAEFETRFSERGRVRWSSCREIDALARTGARSGSAQRDEVIGSVSRSHKRRWVRGMGRRGRGDGLFYWTCRTGQIGTNGDSPAPPCIWVKNVELCEPNRGGFNSSPRGRVVEVREVIPRDLRFSRLQEARPPTASALSRTFPLG